MKRIHAIVQGTVQGVGFRYATNAEADRLGVTGWVRNVGSDRVEAEIQGDERQVDDMRDWLRHGPQSAVVERVEVSEVQTAADEVDFRTVTSA
ncbi:MAG: acylphosphatase [Microbacterium gubbeenense]|uniref:acylphosphatase n=1 Tax=Microbacterium gubbeenense TaxID=159896 RepID=UPI003F95BB32